MVSENLQIYFKWAWFQLASTIFSKSRLFEHVICSCLVCKWAIFGKTHVSKTNLGSFNLILYSEHDMTFFGMIYDVGNMRQFFYLHHKSLRRIVRLDHLL